jgi:hypothetical protein
MLGDLTSDERDWIKGRIEKHTLAEDTDAFCYEDNEDILEFDHGFEPEGDVEESHFWIYSETHGNVDCVCNFVQAFLAKFRPDQTWTFNYAWTCSKPRLGQFGGGKAKVTAKGWTACCGDCVDNWTPPEGEQDAKTQ